MEWCCSFAHVHWVLLAGWFKVHCFCCLFLRSAQNTVLNHSTRGQSLLDMSDTQLVCLQSQMPSFLLHSNQAGLMMAHHKRYSKRVAVCMKVFCVKVNNKNKEPCDWPLTAVNLQTLLTAKKRGLALDQGTNFENNHKCNLSEQNRKNVIKEKSWITSKGYKELKMYFPCCFPTCCSQCLLLGQQ